MTEEQAFKEKLKAFTALVDEGNPSTVQIHTAGCALLDAIESDISQVPDGALDALSNPLRKMALAGLVSLVYQSCGRPRKG